MPERVFRPGELEPHVTISRSEGRCFSGVSDAFLFSACTECAIAQRVIGNRRIRLKLDDLLEMRNRRSKMSLLRFNGGQPEARQRRKRLDVYGRLKCLEAFGSPRCAGSAPPACDNTSALRHNHER